MSWAIQPLAVSIYSSGHESTEFDFNDIRELSQIGVYEVVFAALYFMSLPVARAATSAQGNSLEYSVAFTSIRTIAFCVAAIAFLETAFRMLEISIDHIRHLKDEGDTVARSFWAGSGFYLREVFGSAAAGLALLPFWLFARWIAYVITRPFQSNQVT
ncbi:MAG: hypothetical protein V4710_22780 [Verrucomicrobiota bacterium]